MQADSAEMTRAFNEDIQTLLDDGTIAEILESNSMDPSLAGPGDN